jgi:iron complex outermembrane receptor protein
VPAIDQAGDTAVPGHEQENAAGDNLGERDMNKGSYNSILRATAACLAVAVAAPQAFAQNGAPQGGDTADDNATIIVSARRIEERLQDVPISISVLSAERLATANITGADSLAKYVPGLVSNQRFSSEQASFTIRGFTQELRTSATVGTYFADVIAPRGGGSTSGGDGAGPANLFDLQSVQVLKGPQGTLFGRNTTGGAVLLVPNKPTDRIEGYLEGSYGNFEMFRVQGVLNLPISDSIRLRLGVDRMARDGYQNNVSGIGPRHYSEIDYLAARASLAIDLSPDIENTTIFSYMNSDHIPPSGQIIRANPTAGLGRFAVPQVDRLNASDDRYQVESNFVNPRHWTRQWQAINTTVWQLSDSLTLKNIASYARLKQIHRNNFYGANFVAGPGLQIATPWIFTPRGLYNNNQRSVTEELQLQGLAFDSRLNWQAGLYYEKSSPVSFLGSHGPSTGSTCQILAYDAVEDFRCRGGALNSSLQKVGFTNMAAYAQGTYALTEQLKLTGGLRYTYDRSRGISIGQTRAFPTATFGPPGATSCEAGFTAPDCRIDSRTSSRRATWTVNLTYNPTPDLMLYGSWTRGYRQGAVNPAAAPEAQTFRPESVDAYEIGAKASFQGAVSGLFNIAGYYTNMTNQQLLISLQRPVGFVGSSRTSTFNAGKSRIMGVEADASLRFGRFFRLDGSVNYLDTKLISIVTPVLPNVILIPTADVGGSLPFSPKWSANLSGTVTLPVGADNGRIEANALFRYQAKNRNQAASSTDLVNTAVKQVDLTLGWRDVMGAPIDLNLFANNVTDQFTTVLVSGLFRSLGIDSRQVGEPRTYGVRLKVRFGEGVSN